MDPITISHILPLAAFLIVSLASALLGVLTWIAKQSYKELQAIKKMFIESQGKTTEKLAALDSRISLTEVRLDSVSEYCRSHHARSSR